MLVHVVRADHDPRVLRQHPSECHELGPGVGRPGRVGRAVEDEQSRLRCDRRGQLGRGDLVTLCGARIDDDGLGVAEQHDVRVRDPVGGRDHDLVARVEQSGTHVEDRVLGAGRDDHLGARVGEAVVAPELGDNGVLEFRNAIRVRIAGKAAANGRDPGIGNVCRRVEVGLAGAERQHVLALGLELQGARGDGHRR